MPDPDTPLMQSVFVGEADAEIVALEAQMRKAQLAGDAEALEKLISDDLLFAGPDGQLATKAQDLETHASGIVRFREHRPEELRIRRVGKDVAVASLKASLSVEVAGKLSTGVYRYTRIWARESGSQWRVIGGHVSEVAGRAQAG